MLAVRHPGYPADLPQALRERELPSERKPSLRLLSRSGLTLARRWWAALAGVLGGISPPSVVASAELA